MAACFIPVILWITIQIFNKGRNSQLDDFRKERCPWVTGNIALLKLHLCSAFIGLSRSAKLNSSICYQYGCRDKIPIISYLCIPTNLR